MIYNHPITKIQQETNIYSSIILSVSFFSKLGIQLLIFGKMIKGLFAMLAYMLQTFLVSVLIGFILGIYRGIRSIFISSFSKVCLNALLALQCFANAYILAFIIITQFKSQDSPSPIYYQWLAESFLVFFIQVFIYSVIRLIKNKGDFQIGIEYLNSESEDDLSAQTDYLPLENVKEEYVRIISDNLNTNIAEQRYNLFSAQIADPRVQKKSGFKLLSLMKKPQKFHRGQSYTLSALVLLKIVACVFFISFQSKTQNEFLSYENILFVVAVMSQNIFFLLTTSLGNQDIRRKIQVSQHINSCISITNSSSQNLIDITDLKSIRTWDNSRRASYEMFQDLLRQFEWCYFCLLIYYLFILSLIYMYLGDTYIFSFVGKDSIIFQPLYGIALIGSFLIVNVIFLYRIYFGYKYYETFDETASKLDSIITIYSELIQHYETYFNNRQQLEDNSLYDIENQQNNLEDDDSSDDSEEIADNAQDQRNLSKMTIARKINSLSKFVIDNEVMYDETIYTNERKEELQRYIMKRCLWKFKKIKEQTLADQNLKCYKFLSSEKVDPLYWTLVTLFFFFFVLPSIFYSLQYLYRGV